MNELDRKWAEYQAQWGSGTAVVKKRSDVYRDKILGPAERIAKAERITLDQAVDRVLTENPALYDEYQSAPPDLDVPVGEEVGQSVPTDVITKSAIARYPDLDEPQAVERFLDTKEGAELFARSRGY